MKLNHSISFYKAASVLIGSLSIVSLVMPVAMAESVKSDKEIVAAVPADTDFKKLDVNSDGKISLKEAVKDKALATGFDITDANKDGNITADEYSSYKAASQMKPTDSAAPTSTPAVN